MENRDTTFYFTQCHGKQLQFSLISHVKSRYLIFFLSYDGAFQHHSTKIFIFGSNRLTRRYSFLDLTINLTVGYDVQYKTFRQDGTNFILFLYKIEYSNTPKETLDPLIQCMFFYTSTNQTNSNCHPKRNHGIENIQVLTTTLQYTVY